MSTHLQLPKKYADAIKLRPEDRGKPMLRFYGWDPEHAELQIRAPLKRADRGLSKSFVAAQVVLGVDDLRQLRDAISAELLRITGSGE